MPSCVASRKSSVFQSTCSGALVGPGPGGVAGPPSLPVAGSGGALSAARGEFLS